jgi:hypothetical protein
MSRLIFGSDAGWRGDVTADLEITGTADSAQTKARLRATGVRREEFTPETPLDLDANCSFRYQRSQNAVHNIGCDTALGSGHLHLQGELPGNAGEPELLLEVQQVPLQAGLDLLRTVRSGFAPGISARGTANGSLVYKKAAPETTDLHLHTKSAKIQAANRTARSVSLDKSVQAAVSHLQGALAVTGGILKGGELKEPLILPTITWTPALVGTSLSEDGERGIAGERSTAAPSAAAAGGKGTPDSAKLGSMLGLETRFTVQLGAVPVVPSEKPAAQSGADSRKAAPAAGAKNSKSADSADAEDAETAREDQSNSQLESETDNHPARPDSHKRPGKPSRVAAASATPTTQSLTVRIGLSPHGYNASVSGFATTAKIRELAYAFGLPHLDATDAVEGGTADIDLSAAEPWVIPFTPPVASSPVATSPLAQEKPSPKPGTPAAANPAVANPAASNIDAAAPAQPAQPESFHGAVQIHHMQWKPAFLAQTVELSQGTVTISGSEVAMNAEFGYGVGKDLLHGTVLLNSSATCKEGNCEPHLQLHFGAVDASVLEDALISPQRQKTLLSPLMDRMRPSQDGRWPKATVEVQADSLVLGPTTLHKPVIQLRVENYEATLVNWQAEVLGGTANGTGNFSWDASKPAEAGPEYEIEGSFSRLNAASLGALFGAHWSGSPIDGSGKIKLTGLIQKQLAASAKGEAQFTWPGGILSSAGASAAQPLHFENWTGAVTIDGGKAQLGKNTIVAGKNSGSVSGSLPFGGTAKLNLVSESKPEGRSGTSQRAASRAGKGR